MNVYVAMRNKQIASALYLHASVVGPTSVNADAQEVGVTNKCMRLCFVLNAFDMHNRWTIKQMILAASQ